MKEIWRRFRDSNYSASNTGKIRNDKTGKILKPRVNSRGYCYANINGKEYRIHRVVAECFIPNPDNLPQVNHKDENKLNNSVDNLEWCDNRYNNTYSKGISVEQIKDGEVIARYVSMAQASEHTGIIRQDISRAVRNVNGRKSAGGFEWRFC